MDGGCKTLFNIRFFPEKPVKKMLAICHNILEEKSNTQSSSNDRLNEIAATARVNIQKELLH